MQLTDNIDNLWKFVIETLSISELAIHGPEHWRRVERNGLLLSKWTGADVAVVRLFALFHDSCRENDLWDYGHGLRGAEYAASLRGVAFQLEDHRFELLHYACVWHTDEKHHDDPTIATCWDADRLDLGRVGVMPDPEFMNTDPGRQIAAEGSVEKFQMGTEI